MEAAVARGRGGVPLREVVPACAGLEHPEHPVEDVAVGDARPSACGGWLGVEDGGEDAPLLVGKSHRSEAAGESHFYDRLLR